jgi:hypothetical protein
MCFHLFFIPFFIQQPFSLMVIKLPNSIFYENFKCMGFCINNHYKFGLWIKSILNIYLDDYWNWTFSAISILKKVLLHYAQQHILVLWLTFKMTIVFFDYVYNYLFIKIIM